VCLRGARLSESTTAESTRDDVLQRTLSPFLDVEFDGEDETSKCA